MAQLPDGWEVSFSCMVVVPPKCTKVIVNNRTTVVIWNDKTKTKATCAPEDTFDAKIGFAVCLLKKMYPKRQRERLLKRVEVQV